MNKEEIKKALKTLGFALAEAGDEEVAAYQRGKRPSKQITDYVMGLRLAIQELEEELESLTTAKRNPRYLVSRDGNEVGIFPGYNALMAVNAARKIYGPGKYTSTKTGEAMYLGRGALETERREREERTARAAAKAAAKRDKIQLPKKSRTRRNAAGKADILQQGVKAGLLPAGLVTDLKRLEEGRYSDDPKRRENLMSRAIILRSQLIYRNMIEKDPLNEAAQRALESIIVKEVQWQKQHKQNPRTRRNAEYNSEELDKRFEKLNLYAQSLNVPAERSLIEKFTWLLKDLVEYGMRYYPNARTNQRLLGSNIVTTLNILGEETTTVETERAIAILGRAVQIILTDEGIRGVKKGYARPPVNLTRHEFLRRRKLKQNPRTRRNAAEKDSEHPIEVTRHYRSGGPNYLSPWQRAMAIGQEELFDTGIQMLPRVAERRAALFAARNPGATKRAYESGLKEATAAQLARLVRVGLRVGFTMAEIKKDIDATGRFTAAQINKAMDQARSAEERLAKKQNPTPDQLLQSGLNIQIFADRNERARAFVESLPNGALKKALLSGLSKTMNALMGDVTIFDMPDYMTTIRHILARQIPNKPKWSAARAQLLGFFDDRESNPSVKAIYQKFNGRPSRRSRNVAAPAGTPRDLAQLGRLRTIKTVDGRTWRFPGDRAPFLAADSRGKLHIVGGQYRANPAGEDCGEIDLIEYQTRKPHLGHHNETIYYHKLGEDTGERPTLEITPTGELVIHGGAYRIESDGIHN